MQLKSIVYLCKVFFFKIKHYFFMKSWKTSLCGVVGAMGTTMAAQDNPTIKAIGGVLAALALALMGLAAKDSNVTGGGSNPTVKN